MFTLQDFVGSKGPFRDARGRFRRQHLDEMGLLQRTTHNLAAHIAKNIITDSTFVSGRNWDDEQVRKMVIRLPAKS